MAGRDSSLISAQAAAAKQEFQNLNIGDRRFTISFPPSPAQYQITVPEDFPYGAPVVTESGNPVNLMIVQNWSRAFQLVHVVRQCQVKSRQSLPPPRVFQRNELSAEFRRVTPQQLTTPEGRRRVIDALPCCHGLPELDANSARTIQDAKSRYTSAVAAAADTVAAIRDLEKQSQELEAKFRNIDPTQPARQLDRLRAAIARYRNDEAQAQRRADDIKRRIQNGDGRPDILAKEFWEALTQQNYCRLVAEAAENLAKGVGRVY
jgi:hypothetical protein